MATIYPVPAGRSSDALLRTRLLSQLQSEQRELLQVQQHLSTGRRVIAPSDDAPAASRAITLQRQLEQKTQIRINLDTSQSYLNATDTALSGIADLLANVRGLAIRGADSTTSELERQSIVVEVQQSIEQMMNAGNSTFRDRYLFGGSRAREAPFELTGGYVGYFGNDVTLRSFADVALPFATNISAGNLFGTVSEDMRGIDLNPVLSSATKLDDLRSGRGIAPGSIIVSDGSSSSTVDLTHAETLGDVVRAIESAPPEGTEVFATITPAGLRVEIAGGTGGELFVHDPVGGSTARDLGIARTSGAGGAPIEGADLNPILRLTTRLEDILGTQARTVVRSSGSDNDVVIEAHQRGVESNNYTVQYVDDNLLHAASGVTAGNEWAELHESPTAARAALPLTGLGNDLILTANAAGTNWNNIQIRVESVAGLGNAAQVHYDSANHELTIGVDSADQTTVGTLVTAINSSGEFTATGDSSFGDSLNPAATVLASDEGVRGNTGNSGGNAKTAFVFIEPGQTSANHVVAALQANTDFAARFEARVNPQDTTSAAVAGSRAVDIDATGVTREGSGKDWDIDSGLQINNGGQTHVVEFAHAATIEDLLNAINGSDAMVQAEINAQQNGINLRSRLSGSDFSVGENGGTTATDLGLRTTTRATRLSELNHQRGVEVADGPDFVIQRNDGTEFRVDVSAATTIGDVIDLINNHSDNQDPNNLVIAQLQANGNGLELINDNPVGNGALTISRVTGSFAAWDLGLVARGEQTTAVDMANAATPAAATLQFAAPNDQNNAMTLTAAERGTAWNDVSVVVVNNAASGNQALVGYDPVTKTLTIDLDPAATTAATVIDAVNAEGTFAAALDLTSDPTNDGSGHIVQTGMIAVSGGGSADRFSAADTNTQEVHGIFNSLLRLRDALVENNVEQVQRVLELFDEDYDRLSFGRAEVGAQGQTLDALRTRQENEQLQLQSSLSDEIDVDMTKAVSDFANRQTAYQASLQTMASLFQLTLLDFL